MLANTKRPQAPALFASLLIALIRVYQKTLSLLIRAAFGPVCRFEPSCSAYALACVEGHGALRGSLLSVKRLCRCHPFHPGGFDPPPPPRNGSRASHDRASSVPVSTGPQAPPSPGSLHEPRHHSPSAVRQSSAAAEGSSLEAGPEAAPNPSRADPAQEKPHPATAAHATEPPHSPLAMRDPTSER
jgi:uncharacterized protein